MNIYLFMEPLEGGKVFSRIESNKKYCEKDAAEVIKQVVNAIEVLHRSKIIHRDLKVIHNP
jgi:serine/threonine protein kinase